MDYNNEIFQNEDYLAACNAYLNLANNDEERNDLINILKGYYEDGLSDRIQIRFNPDTEISRRIGLASLYLYNKEVFDYVVEHKINMFHGTTSKALEGIINEGLISSTESEKMGREVTTGEAGDLKINKSFISFTNDLLQAEGYASHAYRDGQIPVIVGTSYDKACSLGKVYTIHSDYTEIGVDNSLPLEGIEFIGVPSEYVDEVRAKSNGSVEILPYDNIGMGFCQYYEGQVGIKMDKYEELKNSRKNKQI